MPALFAGAGVYCESFPSVLLSSPLMWGLVRLNVRVMGVTQMCVPYV